jgi:hypothetical protein
MLLVFIIFWCDWYYLLPVSFSSKDMKRRDHFEFLGVNRRILNEQGVRL